MSPNEQRGLSLPQSCQAGMHPVDRSVFVSLPHMGSRREGVFVRVTGGPGPLTGWQGPGDPEALIVAAD